MNKLLLTLTILASTPSFANTSTEKTIEKKRLCYEQICLSTPKLSEEKTYNTQLQQVQK